MIEDFSSRNLLFTSFFYFIVIHASFTRSLIIMPIK